MSIRLNLASTSCTNQTTSLAQETSTVSLEHPATAAPSSSNRWATSLPRPREVPVTMATLPSRSIYTRQSADNRLNVLHDLSVSTAPTAVVAIPKLGFLELADANAWPDLGIDCVEQLLGID